MDAAHHRALTGDSCYIMLFCAYCLIFYLAILLLHCIMEWMLWDFIKLHKGDPKAKSGNSVGVMQITPILVAECNNILMLGGICRHTGDYDHVAQ